jgi:GNAT superfamily N-acetyltransferase
MKIEKISKKYLDYVVSIIQKRWGYSHKSAVEQANYWLKNTNYSICFVGIIKGEPMATAVFDKHQEDVDPNLSPWNTLLFVEPRYRGKGYGQKLTRKRFEYAKKLGYKRVYLDTTDSFWYHKKMGWKIVKKINYKGEKDSIMKFDLKIQK